MNQPARTERQPDKSFWRGTFGREDQEGFKEIFVIKSQNR